jgi:hypothetical protein
MPTAERAFTLQLMQENEGLSSSAQLLLGIVQRQHAIAEKEGHPFPMPALSGNISLEQLQEAVQLLDIRLKALSGPPANGQLHVIEGKVGENSGPLESANVNGNGSGEES